MARVKLLNIQANAADAIADDLAKTGDGRKSELIKWQRGEAERIRQMINRIQDVRLLKLKRAKAALATEMLPGMGGNRAVVLGNL